MPLVIIKAKTEADRDPNLGRIVQQAQQAAQNGAVLVVHPPRDIDKNSRGSTFSYYDGKPSPLRSGHGPG